MTDSATRRVDKPWGHELIWAHTDRYVGKILVIETGRRLSLQRHEQKDDFGTSPYLFLGPARYVSHTGDRPIAITWRLRTPMPIDFFNLTSAVAP